MYECKHAKDCHQDNVECPGKDKCHGFKAQVFHKTENAMCAKCGNDLELAEWFDYTAQEMKYLVKPCTKCEKMKIDSLENGAKSGTIFDEEIILNNGKSLKLHIEVNQ